MSDGVIVRNQLAELDTLLDKHGKEVDVVQENFDAAAARFDEIWNDLMVAFIDPYKDKDGKLSRLPGEDVRNAVITQQFREQFPVEFGSYHRLKDELARLEKRGKRIERLMYSKQTSLSWLKVEASAT